MHSAWVLVFSTTEFSTHGTVRKKMQIPSTAEALIAKLGAETAGQRAQICELAPTVTAMRNDLGAVCHSFDQVTEVKNAALLEFMQQREQLKERERALAALKQGNAGKWRQLQRLQAEEQAMGRQRAHEEQAEEQAMGRQRAHEAAVALVQRRLQLVESLLSGECEALAAVVRERDEARAAADAEAKEEQQKRKAEADAAAAAATQVQPKRPRPASPPAPAMAAAPGGWLDDDMFAAMDDAVLFGGVMPSMAASSFAPEAPLGGGCW
tara:strand:+ start:1958 stop:2758 length:801 start_codon:yes stop_codon:yes gene_type:complete